MRRKTIKNASGDQILEAIEHCKGPKGNIPVAVIISGFDTLESDQLLENIAGTEGLDIVDYAAVKRDYNCATPQDVERQWKQLINEAMMNRRGAIIKRNFGDYSLVRSNMIAAAKTGMKQAKIILLQLSTDSMRGFVYHREKFGETFSDVAQRAIADNLSYGNIGPGENIDYVLEVAL